MVSYSISDSIDRRCTRCLEHINPRSVTERWSMVSGKEWKLQTAEKCLKEDAQRAESDSHINTNEQKQKAADR